MICVNIKVKFIMTTQSYQLHQIEQLTKYISVMTNSELATLQDSISKNELPLVDDAVYNNWGKQLQEREAQIKKLLTVSPY